MTLRMAIVGAGSNYTPVLIQSLITSSPELEITALSLMDISAERLDIISPFIANQVESQGFECRIEQHSTLTPALAGADVVLNLFRVGGLSARKTDVAQARMRGVLGQETQGWGGFASSLRNVPVAVEVTKALVELRSNAWLVNLTNPVGIITRACSRVRPERVIGLCEMPTRMATAVATSVRRSADELSCRYVGLNHLGWIVDVSVGGDSIMDEVLGAPLGDILGKTFAPNIPATSMEAIARSIRAIPSPYLRYYYFSREVTKEAKTGRSREEICESIDAELMDLYRRKDRGVWLRVAEHRGGYMLGPALAQLCRALLTEKEEWVVPCVVNRNSFPFLPTTAVIETSAKVAAGHLKIEAAPELHPHIRGLVAQIASYEEMTVEAALSGDRGMALAALACHPLVQDVPTASNLLEDTLLHNKNFLPAFS